MRRQPSSETISIDSKVYGRFDGTWEIPECFEGPVGKGAAPQFASHDGLDGSQFFGRKIAINPDRLFWRTKIEEGTRRQNEESEQGENDFLPFGHVTEQIV